MKCIRNNDTKEVKRVSNDNATYQVEKGKWSFCPKSEWKALRVKPVETIVHTIEQEREIHGRIEKKKYQKGQKAYRKG